MLYPTIDSNSQAVWGLTGPGVREYNLGQAVGADLLPVGTLTWGTTGVGHSKAVVFPGSGTVRLQTAPAVIQPAALTVSAWVNPYTWVADAPIVEKIYAGDDSWAAPYVSVALKLSGAGDGTWQAQVTIGGVTTTLNIGTVIRKRWWSHIGLTYDGVNLTAYMNGVQVGQTPLTGAIDYGTSGRWVVGGNMAPAVWDGRIDEVRVCSTARDLAWFVAMREWIWGGYLLPDANDVALWVLDEGTGLFYSLDNPTGSPLTAQNPVWRDEATIWGRGVWFRSDQTKPNWLYSSAGAVQPTLPVTLSGFIYHDNNLNFRPNCRWFGKSYYADAANSSPYDTLCLGANGNNGEFAAWIAVTGGVRVGIGAPLSTKYITSYMWSHIGLTYDGSYLRLYRNGEQINSVAETRALDYGTNGMWYVGGNKNNETDYGYYHMMRVSNVARDDDWFKNTWRSFCNRYHGRVLEPVGWTDTPTVTGRRPRPADYDIEVFQSGKGGSAVVIPVDREL